MNHKNYSFSRVIHRFRADPLIKYIKKKKIENSGKGHVTEAHHSLAHPLPQCPLWPCSGGPDLGSTLLLLFDIVLSWITPTVLSNYYTDNWKKLSSCYIFFMSSENNQNIQQSFINNVIFMNYMYIEYGLHEVMIFYSLLSTSGRSLLFLMSIFPLSWLGDGKGIADCSCKTNTNKFIPSSPFLTWA